MDNQGNTAKNPSLTLLLMSQRVIPGNLSIFYGEAPVKGSLEYCQLSKQDKSPLSMTDRHSLYSPTKPKKWSKVLNRNYSTQSKKFKDLLWDSANHLLSFNYSQLKIYRC